MEIKYFKSAVRLWTQILSTKEVYGLSSVRVGGQKYSATRPGAGKAGFLIYSKPTLLVELPILLASPAISKDKINH